MKVIRFLDSTGDTSIEFDEAATTEAATQAKALFDRALKEGGNAYTFPGGPQAPGVKITDFDQTGAETVVTPRIVGG